MVRPGHFAILLLGAWNVASLAASPQDGIQPSDSAATSPNQSISVEDQRPEARENDQPDGQVVHEAAKGGESDSKPLVFLGRRQSQGSPANPVNHAQTPWYRSSLGALGLVLGLMALLYLGLKRWAPSLKVQDGGLVRVMSRTVVGPRQSLVMVRVGQRFLLVGVSPDRIDRVCEIADADEVAALTAQAAGGRSKAEFSVWLDREAAEFARTELRESAGEAATRSRSGSKSLSELLRKLKTAKV